MPVAKIAQLFFGRLANSLIVIPLWYVRLLFGYLAPNPRITSLNCFPHSFDAMKIQSEEMLYNEAFQVTGG